MNNSFTRHDAEQLHVRLKEINLELDRIAPKCYFDRELPDPLAQKYQAQWRTLIREAANIESTLGY